MKGYSDDFLRVDLSDSSVEKETIPSDFRKRFLGGMGFATWVLYKEVRHADPWVRTTTRLEAGLKRAFQQEQNSSR